MQKGSIRVQTENIFPIIKKFLYSEHDIFLRELSVPPGFSQEGLKIVKQFM
jgi:hypothetical protein